MICAGKNTVCYSRKADTSVKSHRGTNIWSRSEIGGIDVGITPRIVSCMDISVDSSSICRVHRMWWDCTAEIAYEYACAARQYYHKQNILLYGGYDSN